VSERPSGGCCFCSLRRNTDDDERLRRGHSGIDLTVSRDPLRSRESRSRPTTRQRGRRRSASIPAPAWRRGGSPSDAAPGCRQRSAAPREGAPGPAAPGAAAGVAGVVDVSTLFRPIQSSRCRSPRTPAARAPGSLPASNRRRRRTGPPADRAAAAPAPVLEGTVPSGAETRMGNPSAAGAFGRGSSLGARRSHLTVKRRNRATALPYSH
jgi:hypothetical protein